VKTRNDKLLLIIYYISQKSVKVFLVLHALVVCQKLQIFTMTPEHDQK